MNRSPTPILEYQPPPRRQRSWLWALVAGLSLVVILIGGIGWKAYVVRQQMVAQQKALAAAAARNQALARQAAEVRAATNPSR
jgi:hypothetical protein